jgi:multimeric flavodoxin WrbA
MTTVLGLSCSLRNARFGAGSRKLSDEIKEIKDKEALTSYLESQTKIRAADVIEAGRGDDVPFDQIYRNLLKSKGDRGLSNSEAALVAGLWGAWSNGADIRHCGLAPYFPMNGKGRDLDKLREQILEADALILSGPVYFGDRGSITQEFIEFLREDKAVAEHIKDRVYAGISVGAKRNGGQETTLIYQLVDMTNLNMLAVGNDSETTSQYGGTAYAGDVGTMWKDDYGITTSISTGRRVARTAKILELGRSAVLKDDVKIAIWLLQDDANRHGFKLVEKFCKEVEARTNGIKFSILDCTREDIYRCIACDVCPTDPGPQDEYRCIIKSETDLFRKHHHELIDSDAVLMAAYSPIDRQSINSIYQRFIERTRYLRRDDYTIGDRLVAPLVISEINSNQNLHIRMLTSLVRHHTVLHHPIIGMEFEDRVINWDSMIDQGVSFSHNARIITAGRLSQSPDEMGSIGYNPVGYEISMEKRRQDTEIGRIKNAQDARGARHERSQSRLVSAGPAE